MTEAAKREDSMENDATEEIAVDDPLFELSQIMGLDDTPAPSADMDPQIDLEDALLAELAFEPELETPSMATDDPAPTAESLEDELTTMLGGAVSVAAEVPAPDVEAEVAQDAGLDPQIFAEPEAFDRADDELEVSQLSEAVADTENDLDAIAAEMEAVISPDASLAETVDAVDVVETPAEPVAFAEEIAAAPAFETPFDSEFETSDAAEQPQSVIAETAEEFVDESTLSLEEAEMELEKDFAAFFDEELPDTDLASGFETDSSLQAELDETVPNAGLDLMDELANVMVAGDASNEAVASFESEGAADDFSQAEFSDSDSAPALDLGFEQTAQVETADVEPAMASVADIEAVSSDIEHLNAGIEKIFGEQVTAIADTAELPENESTVPDVPAAPVLETTDMSAYEAANAVEVDVPELPDLENEFVAAFESDEHSTGTTYEDDDAEQSSGVAAAIGATVAAAGATVLSRRAGETAMAADEEAFDETRFEAELARDMEFVSHDLGGSDDDELSLGHDLDDPALAAHSASTPPKKRGLIIAAALGCAAIVGAAGIFYVNSNSGAGGSDGPILVEASPEPVKIEPENPGGKLVPNQDRAVFAENPVVPEQEALVPGAEEPVDIAAVPEAALPSSLNGGDAAQKGDDRLVPEATTATANDEIGAIIAPRRVRTLVVRPDGTLVERAVVPTPEPVVSAPQTPEVVAAIPEPVTPAPVETPSDTVAIEPAEEAPSTTVIVPEAPGNDATQAQASETATNEVAAAAPAAPETVPTTAVTTTETATPEVAVAPADQTEAPATSVARTISNPPTIADRPNDQPLNIVNPTEELANTQVAAAPAAAPASAAPATTAASSPFSVQLASLPSPESAQNTANNLARQYSSLIGGRGLVIREAQIEGRGTFYRVRVGASNRAEANQLCGQIKAAGGDCFVTR